MTSQTPAASTPPHLPLLRFTREHLALVLAGIPLTLSVTKLLLISQGDNASLVVLVQSLNAITILAFTLATCLPLVLPILGVLIATDWSPRLMPNIAPSSQRRILITAFGSTLLLFVVFVSWTQAVFLVAVSALIVGIGSLTNWSERRRGRTGQSALVEPVTLLFVALLSLAATGPWLPSEQITLTNGSVRVGYVVAVGDPMTVLWREGGVVYLRPQDIKDRQICLITRAWSPGLLALGRDTTEQCPIGKVSRPKP
jgi:hypothetical protein